MKQIAFDLARFPDISIDINKPSYAHPYYIEIILTLEKLNDLYKGITSWFHNDLILDTIKATRYLPPNTAEESEVYLNRLKRSRFERLFRDAIVKDYAGLLSQLSFDDIPTSFDEYIDNIDLKGNNAVTFFKSCDELALRDGACFVLVEYPKLEGEQSLADRQNKRPYLVVIERKNLINWEVEFVDGELRFVFVVIVEKKWQNIGKYGKELITQYRIIRRGEYEIYAKEEINTALELSINYTLIERGITGLDYIPLVGYSLTEINAIEADFPLMDLADLNLELYQLHSEKREMIHHTVPTLQINEQQEYLINDSQQKRAVIGPQSILWNVDAKWIEPSGNGIEPTQKEEALLREAINQKTLGFLSGNFTPRTATEVELDSAQSVANLKGLAEFKESNINTILKYWSVFDGYNYQDGAVTVDKELIKPVKQWTIQDVLNAQAQGLISQEFGLLILQRNGMFEQFTEEEINKESVINSLSIPGLNQEVLS